ncbi:MAG TPA: glycosyltransferase [Chloroflexi bacterium]|nr:glycosyltransferase [Chloroflexota bacterium]
MNGLPQSEPGKGQRTIVFVTFETEFAKSGGLGAVMGMLPQRMAQHEACFTIAPHFSRITNLGRLAEQNKIRSFSNRASFPLSVGGETYSVALVEVVGRDGFRTYLLSAEGFFTAPVDPYTNLRDPTRPMDPYANPILPARLTEDALFFCAAVPPALAALKRVDDVVLHLQDWETACVARAWRLSPDVRPATCVLTLHNPYDRYLGGVDSDVAAALISHLRLNEENVLTQMIPLMDGPISTVSETFARELVRDPLHTQVFAPHLQHLLTDKGVVGVDNGLFGELAFPFSPAARDQAEQSDFTAIQQEKWDRRQTLAEVLDAYQRELAQAADPNREAWGDDLDLSDPWKPVFLVMGRDDPRQKGFDVIVEAIRHLPRDSARYIFTPMPGAEGLMGLEFLRRLALDRPGEVKVFPFRLSFDAFKALQNGSSYMVMGSLYEPFGAATEAYLAGMPVVARATGGLVQQVVPYSNVGLSRFGQDLVDSFHSLDDPPTGFLFREPSVPENVQGWRKIVDCAYWNQEPKGDRIADRRGTALFDGMVSGAAEALGAAIQLYVSDQARYAEMIYRGFLMLERFSWERAVSTYRRLYDQAYG